MEISSSNLTARCGSGNIPSIPEYLSATNKHGITLVTLASLALILVFFFFLDTLSYVMKNTSSRMKTHTAFVIAVYPMVALASYFAILVPRAHLLAEAVTQGMFMAGMYQLFCLFVVYCGGEAELIRKVKPETLSLQVFPCCCCCYCLPVFDVTKSLVRNLRLLVIQLPIVQGLVYLVLLVMWAERESLYRVNYLYLQPIIIISILFGVWGMAMTINLLKKFTGNKYMLSGKYIVLQLVLILAKVQGLITRSLVWSQVLPCRPPITPTVYGNLIYNILMVTEMVFLSWAARKLYKNILPESENNNVATGISTIGELFNNKLEITLKPKVKEHGHVNLAMDLKE